LPSMHINVRSSCTCPSSMVCPIKANRTGLLGTMFDGVRNAWVRKSTLMTPRTTLQLLHHYHGLHRELTAYLRVPGMCSHPFYARTCKATTV
jgi:hypothetical protein